MTIDKLGACGEACHWRVGGKPHLYLQLADPLVVALGGVTQRAHGGGVAVRQVLGSIRRPGGPLGQLVENSMTLPLSHTHPRARTNAPAAPCARRGAPRAWPPWRRACGRPPRPPSPSNSGAPPPATGHRQTRMCVCVREPHGGSHVSGATFRLVALHTTDKPHSRRAYVGEKRRTAGGHGREQGRSSCARTE